MSSVAAADSSTVAVITAEKRKPVPGVDKIDGLTTMM
jgi:hypothetical protein